MAADLVDRGRRRAARPGAAVVRARPRRARPPAGAGVAAARRDRRLGQDRARRVERAGRRRACSTRSRSTRSSPLGSRPGDANAIILEIGQPLINQLHVPRRDAERARQILLFQRRVVPARRRRGRPEAVAGRDFFDDAVLLFELTERAAGPADARPRRPPSGRGRGHRRGRRRAAQAPAPAPRRPAPPQRHRVRRPGPARRRRRELSDVDRPPGPAASPPSSSSARASTTTTPSSTTTSTGGGARTSRSTASSPAGSAAARAASSSSAAAPGGSPWPSPATATRWSGSTRRRRCWTGCGPGSHGRRPRSPAGSSSTRATSATSRLRGASPWSSPRSTSSSTSTPGSSWPPAWPASSATSRPTAGSGSTSRCPTWAGSSATRRGGGRRTRFTHPRTGEKLYYSTNHDYDPVSRDRRRPPLLRPRRGRPGPGRAPVPAQVLPRRARGAVRLVEVRRRRALRRFPRRAAVRDVRQPGPDLCPPTRFSRRKSRIWEQILDGKTDAERASSTGAGPISVEPSSEINVRPTE